MHGYPSVLDSAVSSSATSLRKVGRLRDALIQAVEDGLSVFGKNVSEIVFYNLEKRFSLERDRIMDDPDQFVKALYSMFGSGAMTVEKMIVKCVCDGFEIRSLNPQTFCDCLEILNNRERARRA